MRDKISSLFVIGAVLFGTASFVFAIALVAELRLAQ